MRIFVASWFFPPNTSSEGIVTYKLLRNSKHNYDVVCSTSNQWGYNEVLKNDSDNINVISIDTDDLNEWREKTIELFFELNEKNHYDYIMTRCMPNESLEVGLRIKEKAKDIKWICSLADPVANNPYVLEAIKTSPLFPAYVKDQVINELSLTKDKWSSDWLNNPSNIIRDQFYWKSIQDKATNLADIIIVPSKELEDYIDKDRANSNKYLVIPHSFDESLYKNKMSHKSYDKNKTHFVFTGYSDALRSLNWFVDASKWIKERYPQLMDKFVFHFYGNYPRSIIDKTLAFDLDDNFDFCGNVSYLDSLSIMKNADWLLHVDAFFPKLSSTGGSIFFAGKLADYLGTNKPILALTGNNSPACNIVKQYGGCVCDTFKVSDLANIIIEIVTNKIQPTINSTFRNMYNSVEAAKFFDQYIEKENHNNVPSKEEVVYPGKYKNEKSLSICVPCYNSENTVSKTLESLVNINNIDDIEIICIDDGSKDTTLKILKEYQKKYPRSITIVTKPNGGHGSGINCGLQKAVGKYFRVVDSDDWVDSKELEKEIDYIKSLENDVDIIYTPYHIVDQSNGLSIQWPLNNKIEFGRIYDFDELISEVGLKDVYFTMASTSFNLDTLRNTKIQLKEKSYYTDSLFILLPIPNVNKVVFIKNYVYKYLRGQSEQSVSPLSFVRHYADHEAIVKQLVEFEKNSIMSDKKREYMKGIICDHLKTNYQILLDFDPNIEGGVEKAKLFDEWLKATSKDYYDYTYRFSNIKQLRNVNYNSESFRQTKEKKNEKPLIYRLTHNRILFNKYTNGFIRKQKENNGIIYRLYLKLKRRG